MTAKNIFRIFLFLILFVAVTAYIIYAVVELREENPNVVCTVVDLDVESEAGETFLTKDKVKKMLQDEHIYPEGRLMSQVNTQQIENVLRANNFIENVECYKAANNKDVAQGKVCIRVLLRTPVIFVMPDNQTSYYVDADGMIIPNSSYTRNIVTATGNINQAYATKELAVFGTFIHDNEFWDNQIEQIYVSLDSKRHRVVTLIPRVGDQIIYMGSLDNFEKKLRRLKVFYEKGIPEFGWNKYKRLDLEYDNQIVCTR